jgi:hypothetical protein
MQLSRKQSTGDDRTEPFHHESAIQWEPGKMMGIVDRGLHRQRQEFSAELVKSLAGPGAYRENAGMVTVKKRAPEECFYV